MKAMILLISCLLALLTSACGSDTEPAPLDCTGQNVGTALIVTCNRPVNPLPAACTVMTDPFTYECNILHANADECAAFAGICE